MDLDQPTLPAVGKAQVAEPGLLRIGGATREIEPPERPRSLDDGAVPERELEVRGTFGIFELRHELVGEIELDLSRFLSGEGHQGPRRGLERAIELVLQQ